MDSEAGFGALVPALSFLPKLEELWLGIPAICGTEEGQAGRGAFILLFLAHMLFV